MKTNAIIRIILFSLAIIILLGILIAGLGIKFLMFDRSMVTTSEYPLPVVSDGYSSSGAVNSEAIRNIDIDWVSGTITIEPRDDIYEISATETNGNEKYQMVYAVSGDILKIQYCKDPITFPSLGRDIVLSKDLTILVPSAWTCDDLNIDAAASDVTINGLTINDMDFDGASGKLSFSNCSVRKLDIDTASGDVEFNGTLEDLDLDAASASFHGTIHNCPNMLTIDSVSGRLDLFLPVDCGFTLTNDSLSGRFNSDFEISAKNDALIHGDGSCKIDISGLSGNVSIKKHASASENAPTKTF